MSRIWKDKIFIICVLVASMSAIGLFAKLIPSIKWDSFSHNSSQPITTPPPTSQPTTPPSSDLKSVLRTNFPAAFKKRSGFMNKAATVKLRPKAGGNEWSVGNGLEFDSSDLDTVIFNAIAGDSVRISPGTYEFSMNKAFKKIHLIGAEGVTLEIKKNESLLSYQDSLQIENVYIKFLELAQSSSLFLTDSAQLILKQCKVDASHFHFTLTDNTKVEAYESKFIGVSFRLNDSSALTLEDSYLEKDDKFIIMSNFSSLKMNRTHFTRFSDSAIYNFSRHTSLKAYDIKIENGDYAFGGSEMDSNDVSHSSFSKLQALTTSKIKINCTMCEMSEIQR